MSKPNGERSLQYEVHGENLNDFVARIAESGRLKIHAEHDKVRKDERQITKFVMNQEKNRYFNAVLFSQGSIDLKPEIKEDSPYINASRLPCPGGALIMAQAPMKETLCDFYRLIWQQQVNTIVCLVNLDDKKQCHPYFELNAGKNITCRKRFRVRTVTVIAEGKHIVHYELNIENYFAKDKNTCRVLNVISIVGWEPEALFDPKVIISAIQRADALKRIVPSPTPSSEDTSAPILIHGCSGIRRTGVFALAYIFSKQILPKRKINLLEVIEGVRMLRYGVLRQKNLFFLLLETIIVLITETSLLQPGSEAHVHAVQVVKNMYKDRAGGSRKSGKKAKAKAAATSSVVKRGHRSMRTNKKGEYKNKLENKDDDEENESDPSSTREKRESPKDKSNKLAKSNKSSKNKKKENKENK